MKKEKTKKTKSKKFPVVELIICVLSFLTVALNFVQKIYDRKQSVVAIEKDETVKLLLKKSTKEV